MVCSNLQSMPSTGLKTSNRGESRRVVSYFPLKQQHHSAVHKHIINCAEEVVCRHGRCLFSVPLVKLEGIL